MGAHNASKSFLTKCVFLQGNGHERDFLDDKRVFIMDMYNRFIYPGDEYAKSELTQLAQFFFF